MGGEGGREGECKGGREATHIMTLLGERRGHTGLQEMFNPAKSYRTKKFCLCIPTSQAQGDMQQAIVPFWQN